VPTHQATAFARVFSADGTPSANDYVINTTFDNNQNAPSGTVLADGRILLAWNSDDGKGSDTDSAGIRAIILNADGSQSGSDVVFNAVTQGSQLSPSVTALEGGGYVIAWSSNDNLGADKSAGLIRATQFDAQGNVVGTADFEVNTDNGWLADDRQSLGARRWWLCRHLALQRWRRQ
jgi:hypothetical protein